MPDLLYRLRKLDAAIQVCLIDTSNIGKWIALQVDATPGKECAVVADNHLEWAAASTRQRD